MINICICEDQPQQLSYLEELLREYTSEEGYHIYGFDHPDALLSFGKEHPIDIVVMDVNFDEVNGIEVVNLLHQVQADVQVIFVTGYSENRSLVYEAEHMYYLDKPIDEPLLFRALQKAVDTVNTIRSTQPPQLLVMNKDGQIVIEFADITYIESRLRKLHIHTVKKGMVETYRSIRDVVKLLDERFVRCHQSFVVNMDYIKKCVKRKKFILDHINEDIPISQARSAKAYKTFIDYIGHR